MNLTRNRPNTGTRITGLGAYRPERIVTNEEICRRIDSSEEWIQERSGIESRRAAAPDESIIDMAEIAAGQALSEAGLRGNEIDVVLVATISHMFQTPAAAPTLAHRLDATPAPAMDLSAACAGFCYGIGMAKDLITAGSAGAVLVVGVEKMTDLIDPDNRSLAFLFGDGAGAAVVSASDRTGIGPTVWGSDGAASDFITQSDPWTVLRENPELTWPTVTMAGQRVFRWAVWQMAPVARKAVEAAGIGLEDLAAFVPHQANIRIVDAMAKQLQLPEHVAVARDIVTTGNTSSASVPIALQRMRQQDPSLSGKPALLIGFGAGLAYGAQVVEIP